MPRFPATAEACLERYLGDSIALRCSQYTIKKYRWRLGRFQRQLQEAGLESIPYKIGKKEILHLWQEWANLEPSTRSWYLAIYSTYLIYHDNHIVREVHLAREMDTRSNVNWLTDIEQATLLEGPMTPLERLVIHLELCHGLRKVEVLRLRIRDLKATHMEVHGKGGKWRSVPYHRDTKAIVDAWMVERAKMVASAQAARPSTRDPEQLIIWSLYQRYPRIGAYSETGNGYDRKVIDPLRQRFNINFSNHTLRRTYGRTLWKTKDMPGIPTVPLETISQLMGHKDVSTTIDYLGINHDDKSDAQASLSSYHDRLISAKKVQSKGEKNG